MYRVAIAIVASVFAIACGAPEDGEDGTSCSVEQREDGAYLTCTDGTEATVVNGQDGANGQDGQDGADGQDGQDGAPGQDGANGLDGADGTGGRIVLSYLCVGMIDAVVGYQYQTAVTESGDVWSFARVYWVSGQASSSTYYADALQGSATGYVQIFTDYYGGANYGNWKFEMDFATGQLAITYRDSDLSEDAVTYPPADECVPYPAP